VIEAAAADGHVNLKIEGDQSTREIEAGLLLVADGANSGLREQLGVAVEVKSYRQHAIVANVAFAQDHRGRAYERFTDDGPVAFLPLLPTRTGEHRAGLVWTLSPEHAEHLQDCDEMEFLTALQARFGYRLGRMTQVGDRHRYPLALVQSAEQVRNNIVVMGNAAHALHPVAGQGYNLALRDVAVLGEVLAKAAKTARPMGGLDALAQYEQRQKVDQARTVQFSDKLPGLFMNPDPLLGLVRDLGLSGLDILPSAKRQFVRQAAGMANRGDVGHA
jgi:2-octaprenyl-6-methoxyphenol hydroxylase